MDGLNVKWAVQSYGGNSWGIVSVTGHVIALDIPFGAYADHIVEQHNNGLPAEECYAWITLGDLKLLCDKDPSDNHEDHEHTASDDRGVEYTMKWNAWKEPVTDGSTNVG